MADRLVGRAAASESLRMVKEDMIKATLSKLQDQEDTEGSTHHQDLLKRGVMKGSVRQLKLGANNRVVHNQWSCVHFVL